MSVKEIGATIYLCEGTKVYSNGKNRTARRVEVCNTNAIVIKRFMEYLRTFEINELNIRARVILHDDNNEEEAKEYWSNISNIPKSQFIKTSWRRSSSWNKKRLPYGTFVVRYDRCKIFDLIMNDINEIFSV